jgi:hypothetical protein
MSCRLQHRGPTRWTIVALLLASPGCVQSQAPAASEVGGLSARQWGSEAARNELDVLRYGTPFLRYRIHTVDSKGNMLREVIQSRQGAVARIVMRDDKPLTPEQDKGEHDRLQAMLDSPAAFARHIRNEDSGKKIADELLHQLPEAMLYTFVPGQPQRSEFTTAHPDDFPEIVIDFEPNPAWHPPTMTADALTGIHGRVWIDAKTHYMSHIEGTVFRGVNFGMGILVHIFPGGKLSFDQFRFADDRWIFSRFSEHAILRILLVKTIKEDAEFEGSNFSIIPQMSYQDAIHQLLTMPLPQH